MPEFRNREEYEQWKAQRLRDLQEKREPGDAPPEIPPGRGKEDKEHERPTGELSGIGDLFKESWEIYKNRFFTLISLYILSVIFFALAFGIFFGSGFLLSQFVESGKTAFIAIGALTGAIAGGTAMFWGLAAVVFAVVDEDLGIGDALGRGRQRVWAFTWFFSIAGFIITGGFLLFLIPGVIFLVWFAFGQFVLAAEDEHGMKALLKSKEYVRGSWFDVFLRLFVVWIVSVVISAVPLIGPLLAVLFMPFMMIYCYLIYKDLKSLKGEVSYRSSAGEKFKWIGAGTLGYLVFPLILIGMLGASLTIPLLLLQGMLSSQGKEFKLPPNILPPEQFPHGLTITPQPQQPVQPGTPVLPPPDAKKPDATGEAVLLRDGVQETFILKTGFFSDTRFADPGRASVEFQIPAEEHSNARRIEITLDSTKTGKHFAHGKAINDAFFSSGPQLNIGESTPEGFTASFRFIADGGQIFPPRESCTIVITSPYTGASDSVFAGEVSECMVHSAGIDHKLSSVKFTMRGIPSR